MGTTSLSRAIRFYKEAKTINSVHSPFFYKLICQLFQLNKAYYDDYAIEQVRASLLADGRELSYRDLGAGEAGADKLIARKVSGLAKISTSNKYKCMVLRNLVGFFQPKSIIEFGTNLGIATSYMHAAAKSAECTTIEGVKGIHDIANEVFTRLNFHTIKSIHQDFQSFISSSREILGSADLVFLDGDHKYDSTLSNFGAVWGGGSSRKVVVVDDINWSADMARAWEEIKNMPDTNTLDIYKMGIVIRDERLQQRTHLKYVPRIMKPWSMGLFG